ncbi:MAG TPA: FHA domain-containing protein [Gemmata sp.]
MGRVRRIYFAAVLGAAGGLFASYLHHELLLDTLAGPLSTAARLAYLLLLGLVVGGAVGFFPALAEGFGALSLERLIRAGAVGTGCGAVGGMVALPLAELLHGQVGGTGSRMFALALFGVAIGVAEGLNGGARWWRGLTGGAAGGAVAGLILELLLGFRGTQSGAGIAALMVIGACVTLAIALFVNVLSDAWLEGTGGSAFGTVVHLGKFIAPNEAVLGSDKKSAVFVYVPTAQPRHAGLSLTPVGTRLRTLDPGAVVRVNGSPVSECLLHDGDRIEMSGAEFVYHERRGGTKKAAA